MFTWMLWFYVWLLHCKMPQQVIWSIYISIYLFIYLSVCMYILSSTKHLLNIIKFGSWTHFIIQRVFDIPIRTNRLCCDNSFCYLQCQYSKWSSVTAVFGIYMLFSLNCCIRSPYIRSCCHQIAIRTPIGDLKIYVYNMRPTYSGRHISYVEVISCMIVFAFLFDSMWNQLSGFLNNKPALVPNSRRTIIWGDDDLVRRGLSSLGIKDFMYDV